MLCRRSNVSWRTRMAFQPGSVLRPFSDASDVGESILLMSRPLRHLQRGLPLNLDTTIGRPPFGCVIARHIATGTFEAQANGRHFGQVLRAQVITHGECPIAGQHLVEGSAPEFIGTPAYL